MESSTFDKVAQVLLVIGGLNWGLVGAFNFNLVESLFGEAGFLTNLVYVLVGLAAVWSLMALLKTKTAAPKNAV